VKQKSRTSPPQAPGAQPDGASGRQDGHARHVHEARAGRSEEAEGGAACGDEPHPHAAARASEFSPDAFRRAASLFRALGDVERLKLLYALSEREVCVTELAEESRSRMPTVSQRLRVLRAEGLVVQRREGKHIFYALADQHVVALVHNALDHASEARGHARAGRADDDLDDGAEEPARPPPRRARADAVSWGADEPPARTVAGPPQRR